MNSEELNELNKLTMYDKIVSPFEKDTNYLNTNKLVQEMPKGKWVKTEKIDGTNIRIVLSSYDEGKEREVFIGSKNNLLNPEDKGSNTYFDCLKKVNLNKIKEYFKDVKQVITIYGEGYGAGIQKGGIYSKEKDFRVFDIKISVAYQDFEYVKKVCIDNQLSVVPVLEVVEELSFTECLNSLKEFNKTLIIEGQGGKPEGIVYKFEPVLLNKYGHRLIYKVKFKDFVEFSKKGGCK